jgi:polysaccharide pyruvyl transferase CsaB
VPNERLLRVGISGSYGGLNLGDEAILKGIIGELRRSGSFHITVFSRNPDDTRVRHSVDRCVPIRTLTRNESRDEVAQLDLFILGGGGILYDADAEMYLREVNLAHEAGVPVMIYAISAGPLTVGATKRAVRDALNAAAVITVRDRQGKQLLEEVGVNRDINVTADPALLLEKEPLPDEALKREGLDRGSQLIGISVREPGPAAPDMDVQHYHELLANAADFMVDRLDADVVYVPMERKDAKHCHAVIGQMHHAPRATVLKGEYSSGQVLSLMGRFDFALGMRLHFLIFAALRGVPFVALPYASKVVGFIEDLGMEMPPLRSVNAGQLIAHIDRSWDWRDQVRARIQSRLPEIQTRARQTNELAIQLLAQRAGVPVGQGG